MPAWHGQHTPRQKGSQTHSFPLVCQAAGRSVCLQRKWNLMMKVPLKRRHAHINTNTWLLNFTDMAIWQKMCFFSLAACISGCACRDEWWKDRMAGGREGCLHCRQDEENGESRKGVRVKRTCVWMVWQLKGWKLRRSRVYPSKCLNTGGMLIKQGKVEDWRMNYIR